MKVLLHRSHHSSSRADGWSGAPDEAHFIGLLVDRIIVSCRLLGIEVLTVDGDLEFHPAFNDPTYSLFIAPHYESDTHGDHARGWFWGRADNSLTAPEDDAFGAVFARRYRELIARTDGPAEHPEWTTINVRDYYGFRLDRAVPGILTELGIGAGADHDWLRAHIQEIADVFALSIAEFGGIRPAQEEEMSFKDDADAIAFREDVRQTDCAIKDVLSAHATELRALRTEVAAHGNASPDAAHDQALVDRAIQTIGQSLFQRPPASPFPGGVYAGESTDFSETIFFDPAQGKNRFFVDGVETPTPSS